MDKKSQELIRSVARVVTRMLLYLIVAGPFTTLHAADLYVDPDATPGGDGSVASPYARITDAIECARALRQSSLVPPGETIVIHVATGTYLGSKVPSVLARNPRYEVLPILLNVPNLALKGSTVLTTDSAGLPTGVQPGTETLLATEDHYNDQGKSLILFSRTTDGTAGDNVTLSGFHIDYLNGRDQFSSAIIVDRVSGFSIRENFISRAGIAIYAARCSGSIEGNLTTAGDWGIVAKGGSRLHPAHYLISGNRTSGHGHNGILVEASGVTPQIDVGANALKLESLPLSEVREDPPFTNETTVTGNDASDNGHSGLRLFIYSPPIKPANPMLTADPLNPRLTVAASSNTLNRNHDYGLVVDGNFALRSIKRPLTGGITVQLSSNALEDNGRGPAFFTFTSFFVWCCGASLEGVKYIQNATFAITDLDSELAGFDYDNPVMDPFDGGVLNNTLIVNGMVIPPGTRISPINR